MIKFFKMGFILALFCAISAGLLAKVFLFTQPIIDLNAKIAYEKAVNEVLAGGLGQAVPVEPRGYSGPISMLVGIDLNGEIIGMKILKHRETPGLGSNIVKDKFLKQFIGKSAADQLEPKQDIDAITGATISSKAVCKGVRDALERSKPGNN